MNFSSKNKLFSLSAITIILILLTFSCKRNYKKTADNNQETIINNLTKIDSCTINNSQLSVYKKNKDNEGIVLKLGNSITTKNITLNNLNFAIQNISNIDIKCSDGRFYLIFNEHIGNSSYTTYHVFEHEENINTYKWTKIYKTESNRQGFSITGINLETKIKFDNYNTQENNNITLLPIYSFVGFQEEKEPNIDDFYNKIKSSFKNKNSKNNIFSDKLVLEYMIQNITLSKENLSKYNDIAYYLEQSKLYNEAIFLLEKIIVDFPNRTVAYINLGDAYWDLNKKKEAKVAYKTYVAQMKALNKETKIPKQVFDRLN